MDNSASCPQLATQGAHELIHDGSLNDNNQVLIAYLSTITVLTEESTSEFDGLVARRNHKWGWLETTSVDWKASQPPTAVAMIQAMPIRPSLEPQGAGPRERETTKSVAVLAIGRVLGTDNFLGLE